MLRLTLEVPREVPAGEPVPIRLRLSNSGAPVELMLQGRPPAFDILVTRPDGVEVWRRMAGSVVLMVLQLRRLNPAEVLEWEHRWDQRSRTGDLVGPGDYVVTGIVPTDPPEALQTAPQPLRISPAPSPPGRSA